MKPEITSLREAIDIAFEMREQAWSPPWWRGHAVHNWKLVPSVFREDRGYRAEPSMLAQFMTKAKSRTAATPASNDATGWLTLARHHGLPTRLLDWSESMLIGLYFAVVPVDEHDAILWALNPNALNKSLSGEAGTYLPNAPPILGLYRRAFAVGEPSGPPAAAVSPDEIDLRILLQQSRFTIHGNARPLDELVTDTAILRSFSVPARAKLRIAAELESVGFRASLLFPDLDTLAREISETSFRSE